MTFLNFATGSLKVYKSSETLKYIKEYRENKRSLESVMSGNYKLVLSTVNHYKCTKANLDDLFQVGVIGLMKAIYNFDLNLKVCFSTYAVPLIKGEMRRYLRDNTNLLRVSRQLKDIAYQSLKKEEELQSLGIVNPSLTDIAAALNVSVELLEEASSSQYPIYSLEASINNSDEEDAMTLLETFEDQSLGALKLSTHLTLEEGLLSLNEEKKRIINKRYYEGRTQMEIATEFHISQAQVSRLEKEALEELKTFF